MNVDEKTKSLYLDKLLESLKKDRDYIQEGQVLSLYLGGGTPSSLSLPLQEKLFSGLQEIVPQGIQEVTIEVNPESVRPDKLAIWKKFGVNRISMGVQSLIETELRLLGRLHGVKEVYQAVQWIREAGFKNLNLDLIYGYQSDGSLLRSVEKILELQPEHISSYSLEIYESLPMAKKIPSVDPDKSYRQFHEMRRQLERAGFQRYEISNFAKPGFESLHNRGYWERRECLAYGLGAHGLRQGRRYRHTEDLKAFFEGDEVQWEAAMSQAEEAFETLMLGFRLREGVDWRRFSERYPDYARRHEKTVENAIEQGWLCRAEQRVKPTLEGMDILHTLLMDFIE